MKDFTHSNTTLHSVRKKKGSILVVTATVDFFLGKVVTYTVDIPDEKYDLRMLGDKQLICVIAKDTIRNKYFK